VYGDFRVHLSKALKLTVLSAFSLLGPTVAEEHGSFHGLLSVYRCEVVHRLEQIYAAANPRSDRDRFIAVIVPGHPHGYVQCIFHDKQSRLYCEASSGFYYGREGAPRTFYQPSQTIDALARLGFDTDDSKGNFNIDFGVDAPPDFNAIADFVLEALHDGYGARGNMTLKFNTPFARRTPSTCVPVG